MHPSNLSRFNRLIALSILTGLCAMQTAQAQGQRGGGGITKPEIKDTLRVNVYADNWFILYINGKLTAVDPIDFLPHNVVSVDVLPQYPMTIAVMAKENGNPKTDMEYGNNIGHAGFISKFSDGTVSNATWRAKSYFKESRIALI